MLDILTPSISSTASAGKKISILDDLFLPFLRHAASSFGRHVRPRRGLHARLDSVEGNQWKLPVAAMYPSSASRCQADNGQESTTLKHHHTSSDVKRDDLRGEATRPGCEAPVNPIE